MYREGRRITAPAAFVAGFSKVAPACSVCWWCDSTSNGGMSIFTGQASKQAPQRVEAYGREQEGRPGVAHAGTTRKGDAGRENEEAVRLGGRGRRLLQRELGMFRPC